MHWQVQELSLLLTFQMDLNGLTTKNEISSKVGRSKTYQNRSRNCQFKQIPILLPTSGTFDRQAFVGSP